MLNKMNKIKKHEVKLENGIKCNICLEGYTLSPSKILGVYTFCSLIKIFP